MSRKITVAYGDGIGPEIMSVVLDILRKAGADLQEDVIEIGEKVYKQGYESGIRSEDWQIIRRNKVFLKAPVTTPQGGGFKSLNVKIRKSLGLFANVRPVRSLFPYVKTKFPDMDVVVIRENEEDLYAGIEHRQTEDVFQCLKLISVPGCRRIAYYAFEYARLMGRKKVTCMTKDNIMKWTDGTFRKIFDETAKKYPDVESEHWIIDIGAAKFSTQPSDFDVLLLPNLYGDIVSDISAQLAGSVGLGGSGNIGLSHAMFEAIHGSAPRRAGQNKANPSGLLNGAILMLSHIGQGRLADKIHKAWLRTIEDGIHTYDIYDSKTSRQEVGTTDFGKAVVERLGAEPQKLSAGSLTKNQKPVQIGTLDSTPLESKSLDGTDIFICKRDIEPPALAHQIKKSVEGHRSLELSGITNRGIKVYPSGLPETFCVDHWRCRFLKKEAGLNIDQNDLIDLLRLLTSATLEVIKTENLYSFSSEKNYSQIE